MSEPREVQVYQILDGNRPIPVRPDVDVIDFRPDVQRIEPDHPSVVAAATITAEMPPGHRPGTGNPEPNEDGSEIPPMRITDPPGGSPRPTDSTPEWADTAADPENGILEEIKRSLLNRCNAIADTGRGVELRSALDAAGLGRVGEATAEQIAAFDKVIESFEG